MNIKDSLIQADAIQVGVAVERWQDAIQLAAEPLIRGGYIEPRYRDAIITSTQKNGAYYVFEDEHLAIPHARPECGVLENSFSLVTLQNPVSIAGSGAVDILILFGATDSNAHIQEGLTAIFRMLDDENRLQALRCAVSKQEVVAIL